MAGEKKLICRIELSKTGGITVKVQNDADKITQTIVIDGTSITTTVKGQEQTSTIIQKDESIAMKCKTFTLEAETIDCKSTKASKHISEDTYTVEATKAMKFVAKDTYTVEGTGAMKLDGKDGLKLITTADTVVEATGDFKGKGMKVEFESKTDGKFKAGTKLALEGTTGFEAKGLTAKVEGTVKLELKAPIVDAAGDGMLKAKGGVTMLG